MALWLAKNYIQLPLIHETLLRMPLDFNHIWQDGPRYAKARIMLNDFTPACVSKLILFGEVQLRAHSDGLMKFLDGINHSGFWRSGLKEE
ncbi:hypothetical protein NUU60_03185 [Leclercia adecarboxylata]|nr:hypothetical protein [Leclercia adecarboxylata]MCV3303762.1 hypothetical protein [Leclercia adecarboxylata]MCV3306420.1 hypothetical protein [Leclercia adecarboxylata]